MQRVIVARPPLFERIAAAFPHALTQRGVLYSWGGLIFNPDGVDIHPALLAHEAVHGRRQGGSDTTVRAWWERYIAEPAFRLSEEAPAHTAEYAWFVSHGAPRNDRRVHLRKIAERLSGPLYGGLIKPDAARYLIRRGVAA